MMERIVQRMMDQQEGVQHGERMEMAVRGNKED